MPTNILHGQPVVDAMLEKRKNEKPVTLGIFEGMNDEAQSYMTQLRKTAEDMPVNIHPFRMTAATTWEDLHDMMMAWNKDPDIDGYFVQTPLPEHLKGIEHDFSLWIAPGKDIDVQGPEQRGNVYEKKKGQILPPTPFAVMKMLKHYGIGVRGKIATVIGDGNVGRLLKVMLGNDGATQVMTNVDTPPEAIPIFTRMSDIVVGAAPVPDQITGDMIKPGATVINVGMERIENKWHGNIHVPSVQEVAGNVSKVLGGLGPVTVASLIEMVFRARDLKRKK
jgi:methylenetetrahydrofolate dehydrogenase (NADP+) / methenyltetrahydrofolate cyclohydrolase